MKLKTPGVAFITCHGGHASRMLSSVHSQERPETRRSLTEAADGSLHACNYTIPLHLLHS